MNVFIQEADGAMSISLDPKLKRLRNNVELVGRFKPEPCVGCDCELQKLTRIQTALYEGVTKGIGGIPKHIILEDDFKEKVRNAHIAARPFLDHLKSQRTDRWVLDCCNLVDDIYGVMAPVELEFSRKKGLPNLDLVEHLGMSKVQLINMLIENTFLPPWFWRYSECGE